MRDEPLHKAIFASINKRGGRADDEVAALYPAEDGWEEVFNKLGKRSGFMHPQYGFKDDPANIAGGGSTFAVDAYVDRDPDVVEARAALTVAEAEYGEADARWQAAVQAFAERNLLRRLEHEKQVPPGSFAINTKLHRDVIVDEAESERNYAEERVRRRRVAAAAADAIARRRYTMLTIPTTT